MNRIALTCVLALTACSGGTIAGSLTAPSMLTVEPLGTGLHVAWVDNSMDEAEFQIERKTTGEFAKIASVVFDTNQFHDSAVTAGTRYTYRVRATSAAASSSYTAEVSQTAPTAGGTGGGTGGTGGGTAGTGGGAAGTGGGTAGTGGGTGVATSLPDGGYSFQQHIVPIFGASCGSGNNSCHSRLAYGPTTGGGCRGWLALENLPLGSKNPNTMANTGCPDRTLHQRLVDLDSWMCEPTRKKYVTARNLTSSQLYQVVAGDPSGGGTCDKMPGVALTRMPPAPAPELAMADKKKLETWIMQGAPNN